MILRCRDLFWSLTYQSIITIKTRIDNDSPQCNDVSTDKFNARIRVKDRWYHEQFTNSELFGFTNSELFDYAQFSGYRFKSRSMDCGVALKT